MKKITGYDFTDDMNKMHDFMLLSKDEFLFSYSYLLNSLHSEHGDLYVGLPAYLQILQVGIIILLSADLEVASSE